MRRDLDLFRWNLYLDKKIIINFVIKSSQDTRSNWYCSYYIFLYKYPCHMASSSLFYLLIQFTLTSFILSHSHLIFSIWNEQHYHQTKSNLTHDNTTNVDNFVTRELYKRDRKKNMMETNQRTHTNNWPTFLLN